MDRRDFIKASAAAGAALTAGRVRPKAQPDDRPNVLLFLCDQMRQPIWFPESAALPNFERLKARGVEFTNHFVSAVPCSPSRACLMTGLHMDQHRVFNNMNKEVQPSLGLSFTTLGHLFQEAGYRTPYFGKWHLTQGRDKKERGLDAYGFEWKYPEYGGGLQPGTARDPDCAAAAVRWLADPENHRRPWFLTLSLLNPHDICAYPRGDVPPALVPDVCDRLPDNFADDLSGKPRCQRQYQEAYGTTAGRMRPDDERAWRHYLDYYYYLEQHLDALLGRTLETLAAADRLDNTIVIFTSDHGDMGGSHRLRSKGPCVYRENVNVPLIVSWPGRFPQGARSEALTQNVDLFPTLAALLGNDVASKFPYLPGRDLGPRLADPGGPELTEHVLFGFTDNINVANINRALGRPGVTSPHHIRGLRTRDWVYARYFDPISSEQEFELYDLGSDPFEMVNLAGDPARRGRERELAGQLAQALANLKPGA